MRSLAALSLLVYLNLSAATATAAEIDSKPASTVVSGSWEQVHGAGKGAYAAKDFAQAEALFRKSATLALSTVQRAISANDLGHLLHHLNREKEAKSSFEQALSTWREYSGFGDPAAITALGLADVLRALGDYKGALKIQAEALAYKGITPDTRVALLNAQGDLTRETGTFELSYYLFDEALATPGLADRRKLDALLGMGDLARHFADYAKSTASFQQAEELAEALHNELLTAVAMRGLAQTYVLAGVYARAEPLYRRSLNLLETSHSAPEQIAITLACAGDLYRLEGKLALAEDAWNRTIALETPSLGANHPQVALILQQLAELYSFENRMDLAQTYANNSYRIMSQTLGVNSPAAGAALASVALVEFREQHFEDAAKHYRDALAVLRKAQMGNDTSVAAILDRYSSVLKAMHRNKEAKIAELEAKTIQKGQHFLPKPETR